MFTTVIVIKMVEEIKGVHLGTKLFILVWYLTRCLCDVNWDLQRSQLNLLTFECTVAMCSVKLLI